MEKTNDAIRLTAIIEAISRQRDMFANECARLSGELALARAAFSSMSGPPVSSEPDDATSRPE